MDSIEKYALFSGHSYDKNDQGAAHSANVTMITGTAVSDSADGVVSVDFGGNTISENDEQAVDVSTTCAVKEGDTVQVSVVGADGTAKSLLVTGVIAGGDRMQADIEGAKDTAASADAAATIAKENAAKANELANEAISNASAANTQAQEAMNSVNSANGKISALQKNVDTMNSDISTAQDAISKNASDITGINQKLSTDYATKGEVSDVKVAVESEIDTKANALTASVAETYAAKSDVTKITDDLSNRISINEKGISSSSDEIKTLKSDTANISKDVNAAQDAASNAQKTADTAVSNANAAQTAAGNAQTAADKAQSTANGASTAAATAQSAADGAKTAASNAQTAANSAKTAADNAKTAADKANSDLAKLTDTVSKQSTKIEQNSGSISSIASRTETVENKFTNYYTKTETNSQIKQTADGINSTVSKKVGKDEVISSINQSAEEVKINANRVAINGTLSVTDAINNAQTAANNAQSAVDNIQVGGRNLLKGTSKEVKEWTIPANITDPWQYHIAIPSSQPIRAEIPYGCEYRASVDVLFPADNTIYVDINNAPTSGNAWAGNDNDNREKRVNLHINVKGGIWTRIFWGSENSNPRNTSKVNLIVFDGLYLKTQPTEVKAKWKCMKVEIGNRATDWTPAPEDVQNGIDAAQSTANAANSTANATKTCFYNDSSGSHVVSQNSTGTGTRTDVKADGMHVVDQDDGKELASFTSNGAAIGKESEIHTKYSTDGINFYEKNKSYPFTRIYPVSIEKEKYSAASISSAPSDITDSSVMDDGFWHSTGAVSTSAVDGTSTDNNGWARAVLGATTVQSGTSKSASVEVFASSSNPNKGSGGVGGVDNYINMTADEVYINNTSLLNMFFPIGKLWISTDPTSPASIVGGSWEQIKDKQILAAGDTYKVGTDYGSATHRHQWGYHMWGYYGHLAAAAYNESCFFLPHSYDTGDADWASTGGEWGSSLIGVTVNGNTSASTKNVAAAHKYRVGYTDKESGLDPSYVAYVWRRIA